MIRIFGIRLPDAYYVIYLNYASIVVLINLLVHMLFAQCFAICINLNFLTVVGCASDKDNRFHFGYYAIVTRFSQNVLVLKCVFHNKANYKKMFHECCFVLIERLWAASLWLFIFLL